MKLTSNAIRARLTRALTDLGIIALKASGAYNSYFGPWRWSAFDKAERYGLHILPVHYYSPIPEVSRLQLDDNTARFLAAPAAVVDKAQRRLIEFLDLYEAEFREIEARPVVLGDEVRNFSFGRAPYSRVDALVLYSIIRQSKPARIVEVGCGHTTLLIAEAIRHESGLGYAPIYQCIEPFRPEYLRIPPNEVTEFIEKPIQSMPLEFFESLGRGDILFIDSSHVVSYGSDTVFEILSVLPRLKAGVLVHFHDIFLPYDYPSEWLREARFFWAEQYLLDAFLRGNQRFDIVFPLNQICKERAEQLSRLSETLENFSDGASAFWLEVAKSPP